jgi:hypothetical protein
VSSETPTTVRPLFAWEIQEARRVFAGELNYEAVRIHENAAWLKSLHKIGSWLKRVHNDPEPKAITMGNHCIFPGKLYDTLPPNEAREISRVGWLIHELTHVWQFQRMGWRYLFQALVAQFRLRDHVYDFGGEAGLVESHSIGWKLIDFNLEQQGDIARTYYQALRDGKEVSAWQPFIEEYKLPFSK